MTEIGLREYIAKCRLGVLGTVGPDARPQSSLVGIAVTGELEILFDTVKSSRKYGNLIARPSCSFSMGGEGEQTVQYEGEAAELAGGELERLQPVYFERWPECRAHQTWPGIVYFVVRPRWIRYSDYDQQPPLIQEFAFDHLSR
ncbi:MAG TPA: pyridoxamine 5'-phosphate oxidase family protein [Bryobacteraceae bacterium]|jgi:hypothetical protein